MQKIGILGGGQLGRMLLQASANYVVKTYVLENDADCPAAHLCHHFIKGDITNYEDVVRFGEQLDAITIEIENVNVDALVYLEQKGVRVYPSPSAIRIIKNKITQKQFYQENEIPTADFLLTATAADIDVHFLPAVHKLGEGGYDGKGVEVLKTAEAVNRAFNVPAVLEKMVEVEKEIAIIVAKNDAGEMVAYPVVEMIFDPILNLLDYQLCPANIASSLAAEATAIACKVVDKMQSSGLFAVELFIDKKGEILVNETAPRVHNSGHHTIEASYSSQYDMLWRIMLQLPLGNPAAIQSSAIVNILGAEGFIGKAIYEGLDDVLRMHNAFVHLYGKAETKPGRKMGHVTLLGGNAVALVESAKKVKDILRVTSNL